MSATINDRDVWLGSFLSRFEAATVQYGSQIGMLQATGNGLSIAAAKKLDLIATQQAFVTANGSTEPPVIILSPTLRNLTGPPSYSVVSGAASITTTGDAVQIFFNSMNIRATIRGQITDGSVTYSDQITLVKLNSNSGVVPLLTNEYHSLLADTFGNVLNYIGVSGTFRVWDGVFEVTAACDFSIVTNTGNLLIELSNLGQYSVTGIPTNVDSADVVMRAAYNGSNYDQTFTVVKIKAPAGTPADPSTYTAGGLRLPTKVSVPVGSTFWSNATATAMFTSVGGPVLNDVCTEYNNVSTPPFKETRFYAAGIWNSLNASIDGNLIVTGTIGADQLATYAVTADKLAIGAVGASILPGSITGTLIADGTITTAKVAANAITADQIAAGSITTDKIAVGVISGIGGPGTITGTMIASGTITTANIAANAITAAKILAGTITADRLAIGVVNSTLGTPGSITGTMIASGTITTANLGANVVTAAKIAAGTITADRIAVGVLTNVGAPGSITGTMIANGTITSANIAANTITAANIQAGTITSDRLAVGVVNSTLGNPGTITGTMIADGTITTAKIAANAITADRIAVGVISNVGQPGSITGTMIASGTITTANLAVNSISADRITAGTISADRIVYKGLNTNTLASGAVSNNSVTGVAATPTTGGGEYGYIGVGTEGGTLLVSFTGSMTSNDGGTGNIGIFMAIYTATGSRSILQSQFGAINLGAGLRTIPVAMHQVIVTPPASFYTFALQVFSGPNGFVDGVWGITELKV